MRWLTVVLILSIALTACVGRAFQESRALPTPDRGVQPSYLSAAPTGYRVRIDCLDFDKNGEVTVADLNDTRLPDLNFDGTVDGRDTDVLAAVSIPLKRQTCLKQDVQFLITPPRSGPPQCDGTPFVIVVGITGATSGRGLESPDTGAGVRSVVDEVLTKGNALGWQTAVVLATPDVSGAENVHSAAESWLEAILVAAVERYPCAQLVVIGHSYGGATATAVSAEIERRGYNNVQFVGLIDRVTTQYIGDGTSLPARAPILNVFQENEQPHSGAPNGSPLRLLAPSATDWDVSRLKNPPLLHATIDGDPDVQACLSASAVMTLDGAGVPDCIH